jgi:putative spermidine/putrescine transport system substrate-binding protein
MITRRRLLSAAAIGSAALHLPLKASSAPLKVSGFGGIFQQTLQRSIVKAFTEETGIPVETMSQGTGDEWLFGMVRAVRAGLAPVDVTIFQRTHLIRMMQMGERTHSFNLDAMPMAQELSENYLFNHEGKTYGVGVMSWFHNIVVNSERLPNPPTSWQAMLEDERLKQRLSLHGWYSSGTLEILARTYLDDAAMTTRAGLDQVFARLAAVKPNVKLWWTAESQLEQALRNGEIDAGIYPHDVALSLMGQGFPIQSIFPEEGPLIGVGFFSSLRTSKKPLEAQAFINFCARPDIQEMFAREMNLAPVRPRHELNLNDAEFNRVSTERPPVYPAANVMVNQAKLIQRQWQRTLTA